MRLPWVFLPAPVRDVSVHRRVSRFCDRVNDGMSALRAARRRACVFRRGIDGGGTPPCDPLWSPRHPSARRSRTPRHGARGSAGGLTPTLCARECQARRHRPAECLKTPAAAPAGSRVGPLRSRAQGPSEAMGPGGAIAIAQALTRRSACLQQPFWLNMDIAITPFAAALRRTCRCLPEKLSCPANAA